MNCDARRRLVVRLPPLWCVLPARTHHKLPKRTTSSVGAGRESHVGWRFDYNSDMSITGIDHIVLRVNSLDDAIASFTKLGMTLTKRHEHPDVGKIAFFRLADSFYFELVEPLSPDSAVGQALAKRGEGVHTISLAVDDLAATKAALVESGAPVLDGGSLPVAFIHPKAAHGVMLQINVANPSHFE